MYKITCFNGDQHNTEGGAVAEYADFESLTKLFGKCRKGKKHSAYWVRGELEGGHRTNENLKSSKLIVIDGDCSETGGNAPRPKDVHKKLRSLSLNHCIYTTHSHTGGKNKFRVVLPCEEYTSEQLISTNCDLMKLLDMDIKNVSEMNTWSQPWFMPSRDNPEDGVFEFYSYVRGEDLDAGKAQSREEAKAESGNAESLDEMYENIRSGKEYHESLRCISWQVVKDGMSKAHCKSLLKMLMNSSSDSGSKRWMERYDDIDRLVDGIKEGGKFNMDGIEEEGIKIDTNLPRPPGLMGDLYDFAYGFLMLQYPEVAIAAALGTIAGICGRRYNIDEPMPSGLNLFITVIAGTGVGKDRINDFINMCIMHGGEGMKSYESFIGPSHFHSPKAIVNQFKNARSRICVISEAGLMLKVRSGNVEGTTAFVLDAIQCSHRNGYTKAHAYSSEDDNMERIRAMAMTVVSESTPEQMFEAYASTGALDSGYLPRQVLLKINKRQTKMNRRMNTDLPPKLRERIGILLEECASVQAEADPKPWIIKFTEEISEEVKDYIDNMLELSSSHVGDKVRQQMATRIAQKAIRISAIVAVFNAKSENIVVGREEWEWAKAFAEYEYAHITEALGGLTADSSQRVTLAVRNVYIKMKLIIDDDIKDRKCKINKMYRTRKIIPMSALRIACKANPHIAEMSDKSGKFVTGLDKVLDIMRDNGAIKVLSADPLGGKSPRLVEILEGMNEFIRPYNID